MDSDTVNSVGLFLDIVGVVLLFVYGLPSDVGPRPSEFELFSVQVGPKDVDRRTRRWRKFRIGSRLGLGLLVYGFVLQILSNHASAEHVPPLWIYSSAVVIGICLWAAYLATQPSGLDDDEDANQS